MKQENVNPTTVNEYFAWLEQTVRPDTALYRAAHEYLEGERTYSAKETEQDDTPFLSVITRTQGKRPDMLTETLLSLTGQSNTNFELLIMGHNLTEEQHKTVSDIISDLPDWMREKTRLIPVTGGTRTTPLNAGFDAAKGKYISFLDDDDLALDNWVEAFYELYLKNPGKVLHMYTLYQDWETVGGDFPNTPRAADAPETKYCCDFKMLPQLSLNKCPPCGLAFPARVFQEYGVRFDEALTTTEDWDYLMRCVFLAGIATTTEAAALYRNWLNAENSSTVHKKEEWDNNYKRIIRSFVNTPIVMPAGSLHGVVDKVIEDLDGVIYTDDLDCTELFYNNGEGFAQDNKWKRKNATDKKRFPYVYAAGKESGKQIYGIRFDPLHHGSVCLTDLVIRVIRLDGEQEEYGLADIKTNGYLVGEKIIFLKNDPQIVLDFAEPIDVKELQIGCRVSEHVMDEDIDAILTPPPVPEHHSLLYRGLRKIYRGMKKLFQKNDN